MGKIPQKGQNKVKRAPKELALTEKSGTVPVKTKKASEKKKALDKVNLDMAAKKPVDRELKYKYPEDVTSAQQKKEFRRKMRTEKKSLEAKVNRLTKSGDPKELKAAQGELEKLHKSYFN